MPLRMMLCKYGITGETLFLYPASFVSGLPGGGLGRRISSLRSDIRWPSPGGLTTATVGDLRSAACFCILTPLESKLSGGGLGRRISSLRSDIRWPSPGGLTTATAGDLRSAACFVS